MRNLIVELFNDSGMSIREFANRAELKYSTAHDIVTGKANIENIGAGAFVRIAKVLGTSADALITGCVNYAVVELSTPQEQQLLDYWNSMDAQGRERLLEQAAFLAERHPLNQAVGMGA